MDSDKQFLKAVENGEFLKVKQLLVQGVNRDAKDSSGWTALMLAVWNGHTGIVKLLLEQKFDVDGKHPDGSTALAFAARKDNTEIAQLLINHGALINNQDQDGCTPLMRASWRGNFSMVKTLIENGADIDIVSKTVRSAFNYADDNNNPGIASLIKSYQKSLEEQKVLDINLSSKNDSKVSDKFIF